ncbi:hypothetical protein JCM11641_000195 [Rhodosporidiobolus odoratus]
MSAPTDSTDAQANTPTASSANPPAQHPQLALPAPPESKDDEPLKLDVSTGESVSLFDRLGPTVVNSDGTLSRISNWSEMGDDERKRILRVLGKRNQMRLDAKKAELSMEGAESGSASR